MAAAKTPAKSIRPSRSGDENGSQTVESAPPATASRVATVADTKRTTVIA